MIRIMTGCTSRCMYNIVPEIGHNDSDFSIHTLFDEIPFAQFRDFFTFNTSVHNINTRLKLKLH
jgi:hypothetical protein